MRKFYQTQPALERGGCPVRKPMRQWTLKIYYHAERLLNDSEELDQPESIKDMQRNWIGKSTGANNLQDYAHRQGLHRLYDLVRHPFGATMLL